MRNKTIIEEKKDRIAEAKKNGYRYLTYTYSTIQESQENEEAFAVAHDESTARWIDWSIIPETEIYTCCIYDLEAEQGSGIIIIEKGSTPLEARKNAMAAFAGWLLKDTVDHCLGNNASDAVQVLTIPQLIASGESALVSDAKYQMTGDFLKNWLAENNLSQNKAAELCAVTPRTFRRWVAGKPPMPRGMWELLKIKSNYPRKLKKAQSEKR